MELETECFQEEPCSYGFGEFHPMECLLDDCSSFRYGNDFEEQHRHVITSGKTTILDKNSQQQQQQEFSEPNVVKEYCNHTHSSFPDSYNGDGFLSGAWSLQKRRRAKSSSSGKDNDVNTQRISHITVERNRRKQMNDYLTVLRSLMPPSYSQRGDQASILGGAIDFVKDLEQLVQFLQVQKQQEDNFLTAPRHPPLFSNFFTFPQYPSCSARRSYPPLAVADVEVTTVDSNASIRVLSRKRPKQLLKMVTELQSLRLTILHLNITTSTVDNMVLYSFSVKVEDECQLSTSNEIASAVHEVMMAVIEDEAVQGY